jgi:hypothetical protein
MAVITACLHLPLAPSSSRHCTARPPFGNRINRYVQVYSRPFQLSSIVFLQHCAVHCSVASIGQAIDRLGQSCAQRQHHNELNDNRVRGERPTALTGQLHPSPRVCCPIHNPIATERLITIEQDTLCQRPSISLMRISLLRVPDLVEATTAERLATMIITEFRSENDDNSFTARGGILTS